MKKIMTSTVVILASLFVSFGLVFSLHKVPSKDVQALSHPVETAATEHHEHAATTPAKITTNSSIQDLPVGKTIDLNSDVASPDQVTVKVG